MSRWVHRAQAMPDIDQTWMVMGPKDRCGAPLPDDQMPWLKPERRRHFICGCTTPTPDPASPCDLEWCQHRGAYWWHTALRVGGDHDQWDRLHPHQPTRCTCGHPIEERA